MKSVIKRTKEEKKVWTNPFGKRKEKKEKK